MDFRINDNGSLTLLAAADERDDLAHMLERIHHKDHGFLADVLEREGWDGNGRLHQVQPEWIAALTDAPILTDGMSYPEGSDVPEVTGRIWWFPQYELHSFAQQLIERGEATFALAPQETSVQAEAVGTDAESAAHSDQRAQRPRG